MTEDPGLRLVDFLDHIAEASRLALEYVAGMDQQAFLGDRRTQQAVVLNLMVIGEAAARAFAYPRKCPKCHLCARNIS